MFPREHGAWAMLAAPFISAAVLARSPAWLLFPAACAVLSTFCIREPLTVLARQSFLWRDRKPESAVALRFLAANLLVLTLSGSALLYARGWRILLPFACGAVILTAASIVAALKNRQRSVWLQSASAIGLSASSVVAWLAASPPTPGPTLVALGRPSRLLHHRNPGRPRPSRCPHCRQKSRPCRFRPPIPPRRAHLATRTHHPGRRYSHASPLADRAPAPYRHRPPARTPPTAHTPSARHAAPSSRPARPGPICRLFRPRDRCALVALRLDVHPRVDVRMPTEVPHHVFALQLPHVPNAVVADVQVLVERHRQ